MRVCLNCFNQFSVHKKLHLKKRDSQNNVHVQWSTNEPHYEKTDNLHYAKTKTQISSAVTEKLISAFVFASTVPLLSKSKISSFQPSSVLLQLGLCRTCSETTLLVFPRGGSNNNTDTDVIMQ